MCSFYCQQNNGQKMGPSNILSVIHTITVGKILDFNGGKNRHGIKNVTCEQTLTPLSEPNTFSIHIQQFWFSEHSLKQCCKSHV